VPETEDEQLKGDYFSMNLKKPGILRKVLAIVLVVTLISTAGLLTACNSGGGNNAPQKDFITIGFVAPFSGPLAAFTVSLGLIAEKALDEINKDGGIYISEYDRKLPMRVIWGDSESNPTVAMEVATKLVLEDDVDILVGAWTPATINPVSAVAENHQIPALMENGPLQSWMSGGPYQWAFGNVFDGNHLFDEAIAAWDNIETNKKVGLLFDNDIDGVLFSAMTQEKATARGYTVFDPGRFPAGTTDYTALIAQYQQEGCDIVIGNMILPDFINYWGQSQQAGFIPRIMNIGKGLHFNTDADAIEAAAGNAEGLTAEVMWNPTFGYTSPLTGQNSAQQGAEFSAATGHPPSTTIGYDWQTFETLWQVMELAQSLDKEKIRNAFRNVDFESSYGRVKYTDNICLVPVVAGQWVRDDTWGWKTIVLSSESYPRIPSTPELMFVIPGSK